MSYDALDRRKHLRRPILDTFSFFAVIPSKGSHQVKIHDLSEGGVGFDFDVEGENQAFSPLHTGDVLDLRLFLNQSLSIPIKVRIAVIRTGEGHRRVGGEWADQTSAGYQALLAFLNLIDELQRLGISISTK